LDGETHQRERVVVAGRPVEVERAAAGTAVDEHPLAAAPDTDRDGFHGRPAVVESRAVTGPVVDMATPQAVGTVVAMGRARGIERDVEPAVAAPEGDGPTTVVGPVALIARQRGTSEENEKRT
jgi:hypothetical protein